MNAAGRVEGWRSRDIEGRAVGSRVVDVNEWRQLGWRAPSAEAILKECVRVGGYECAYV